MARRLGGCLGFNGLGVVLRDEEGEFCEFFDVNDVGITRKVSTC